MVPSRITESWGKIALDGRELQCGEPIDVLLNDTWVEGRVEYSHNDVGRYVGWYFATVNGWCPLAVGMRARRG